MKLYCGKHADGGVSVPTNIVMHLSPKLLIRAYSRNRHYYTKNAFTGTLRSNRRGNPKEVINKKLKEGRLSLKKIIGTRGTTYAITKHTHETVIVHKRTGDVEKPGGSHRIQ
nr:unnamed protein product [Callosobruchus chinensis]